MDWCSLRSPPAPPPHGGAGVPSTTGHYRPLPLPSLRGLRSIPAPLRGSRGQHRREVLVSAAMDRPGVDGVLRAAVVDRSPVLLCNWRGGWSVARGVPPHCPRPPGCARVGFASLPAAPLPPLINRACADAVFTCLRGFGQFAATSFSLREDLGEGEDLGVRGCSPMPTMLSGVPRTAAGVRARIFLASASLINAR